MFAYMITAAATSGHVSEETVEESHFEEEVSEQTIRETQTFVIKGVHDPRSDSVISIYEAIADGIISQTQVSAGGHGGGAGGRATDACIFDTNTQLEVHVHVHVCTCTRGYLMLTRYTRGTV